MNDQEGVEMVRKVRRHLLGFLSMFVTLVVGFPIDAQQVKAPLVGVIRSGVKPHNSQSSQTLISGAQDKVFVITQFCASTSNTSTTNNPVSVTANGNEV